MDVWLILSTHNASTLILAGFCAEQVTEYWAFTEYYFQCKILGTEALRGAHTGGTNIKVMRRYLDNSCLWRNTGSSPARNDGKSNNNSNNTTPTATTALLAKKKRSMSPAFIHTRVCNQRRVLNCTQPRGQTSFFLASTSFHPKEFVVPQN